jgi:hypothetical protein
MAGKSCPDNSGKWPTCGPEPAFDSDRSDAWFVKSVYRLWVCLSLLSCPMVRPRGKSRSTATPASTPTYPSESFIQKRFSTLHRGDIRTLAASSIAVASSIGSPSLNQSCPQSSDEQKATHISHPDNDVIGQESSSQRAADLTWQTAYSTARMVIDITKESSDMLLPLKAIVGALSVLIKNYDVSPISVTTELLCLLPAL